MTDVVLAPTATKLGDVAGAVVVSGSHGGVYAGYLIARAGARALVLNDAGVGRDGAGIGSLPWCEALGMAAATADHDSARIADAEDMIANGVVSHANAIARAAGCVPGTACREAAERLRGAPMPTGGTPTYAEARHVVGENAHGLRVVCIDSISLVCPDDDGQVVLSGSHGALVAGMAENALRIESAAAFFNDAGVGKDGAGIARLPVLDARGIAGATVDAMSARIGDGRSTLEDGVLSHVNAVARGLGMAPGMRARAAVELVRPRAAMPRG